MTPAARALAKQVARFWDGDRVRYIGLRGHVGEVVDVAADHRHKVGDHHEGCLPEHQLRYVVAWRDVAGTVRMVRRLPGDALERAEVLL